MRHVPLLLSNGLMTRSGLEPRFLMVDLCSEVRLGLVDLLGKVREMVFAPFKEQCKVGRD